jgi:hypothetical protein
MRGITDINVHHFGYVHSPGEMSWKLNWEKIWEKNTINTLLAQPVLSYTMPDEIAELLNG